MPGTLDTTNAMLAIIAAVSVLQGLVLIAVGIAGFKLYRTVTATLREIDEKRVQPLTAKVDGILSQVHQLGERVQRRAEKVEAAIDDTVGKVDHTAARVKSSVNDTVRNVADAVTGIRAAIVNVLTTESDRGGNGHHRQPPPPPLPMTPAGRDPLQTHDTVREGGF